MKTTTVPAQVTTVEDKVAGNLNLTQMFLLALSVFASFGLYILIPPHMKFSPFKILVCLGVLLVCASLAFRIRGKILAQWIVIIIRYHSRPGKYVYNKNDTYLRHADAVPLEAQEDIKLETTPHTYEKRSTIPAHQILQLEHVVVNPEAQLAFQTTKKGDVYVHITEVK